METRNAISAVEIPFLSDPLLVGAVMLFAATGILVGSVVEGTGLGLQQGGSVGLGSGAGVGC